MGCYNHPPVELATTGDNRHRIACPGAAVELRPPYLTSSHGPAVRPRRARPRARVTRKSFRYSASMCLKKTWAKSVVGFDPDAALLGQALGLGWASKPATRRVEISLLLFRNAFPSCACTCGPEGGRFQKKRGKRTPATTVGSVQISMEKRGSVSGCRKARTKRAGSEGASMPPGTCWSVAWIIEPFAHIILPF
jgi:hypothetical protein